MSDSCGNTNNKQSAADNSGPEGHATTIRSCIEEHREFLVVLFILAGLACVYPLLSNSSYKSSADFHLATATTGAILGLIAGFALIVQFNLMRNRFYLFIGLAFLVNGAGDLIQGLLLFGGVHGIAGLPIVSVDRFIPTTYVAGRLMMGIIILGAFCTEKLFRKSKNPRREILWTCLAVIAITILTTAVAFMIPLPRLINPQFTISQPVDYTSALILAVAFLLFFQKYARKRDMLMWWVMLSIGINAVGQLMMSFSKSLYDAFFDTAHAYKILGYAVPLLGFFVYQIAIVNERKTVGTELQRAVEQLRKRVLNRSAVFGKADAQPAKDTSDHKNIEGQLEALKHQLEFILGVTKTGLDIIDSDFNVKFIDPEWQKAYGDPAGRKCYQYFMDRDDMCPGCGIVKALETKSITVTEKVLVRENNRPVQTTSIPFQNEQGQWLIAEVNVDITERKMAEEKLEKYQENLEQLINEQTAKLTATNKRLEHEILKQKHTKEALRQSEDLLSKALDSISNGILVLDSNFHCTLWNRAMERIFNISKDRVLHIKKPAWEMFPAPTRRRIRKMMQKAMQGQTVQLENIPYLLPNGKYGLTTETFIPLKARTGEIHGLVGVVRDVTEHKWAQDSLEGLNEDMETTVKYLARSGRELRDLIQVAAHDLKNSLRAISNLATFISTDYYDKLEESGRKNVDLLVARAEETSGVIDCILRYAQIGRSGNKEKQVDLNALLPEVISQIEPPENIRITVENELPTIVCEKTHLREIFKRLLNRAIKAAGKRPGQVKVACSGDNEFWKFSVTDDGPCIGEEHLEKILRMPTTLSPRDDAEAAGLSLSAVRRLVELYNGKIWVGPGAENGNVFTFILPKQERRIEDAQLEAHIAC